MVPIEEAQAVRPGRAEAIEQLLPEVLLIPDQVHQLAVVRATGVQPEPAIREVQATEAQAEVHLGVRDTADPEGLQGVQADSAGVLAARLGRPEVDVPAAEGVPAEDVLVEEEEDNNRIITLI